MNKDRPILSATELQPTKYTFQWCIDCLDIAARARQTTLIWQKQVFIHTRLSRAYLALARLSYLYIVNVSASTEAFVGTVCLIAIHRSVSGRTGCRRCGRVDKTPRLCSSTCLAPSWYVSPPWSICPLCCFLCRWVWRRYISGRSKTSRWTDLRGHINSPTSTTTCSPRNWAANGNQTDVSDEGFSRGRNVNNIHHVSKKTCKIIFVITMSNFHQIW